MTTLDILKAAKAAAPALAAIDTDKKNAALYNNRKMRHTSKEYKSSAAKQGNKL